MGGKKLKDFEAGLADNADVVVLRKELWQGLLLQVVGSMYRVRAPLGSILRIPLHALLSGAMLLRQACWSLLNLVGNEYITEFHFASLFHSPLISTMSSYLRRPPCPRPRGLRATRAGHACDYSSVRGARSWRPRQTRHHCEK